MGHITRVLQCKCVKWWMVRFACALFVVLYVCFFLWLHIFLPVILVRWPLCALPVVNYWISWLRWISCSILVYVLWGPSRVLKLFTFTALLGLTVLLSHLLPCSSCQQQQQQQQLWEAVARRESGAGQQMELVEAASGWAGGEDTTTDGAPQAHPLHQSKTKVLCYRLSRGKLT